MRAWRLARRERGGWRGGGAAGARRVARRERGGSAAGSAAAAAHGVAQAPSPRGGAKQVAGRATQQGGGDGEGGGTRG